MYCKIHPLIDFLFLMKKSINNLTDECNPFNEKNPINLLFFCCIHIQEFILNLIKNENHALIYLNFIIHA